MTRHSVLNVTPPPRGFAEITEEVRAVVARAGVQTGLCHLFLRHTSASLLITENADPEVRRDLERWLSRLAPDGDPLFRHDQEGPDDMPAHVRNMVAGYQLTVPIHGGELALGTWQGIYVWEHRTQAHRREVALTIVGN
jgi:secondary thiamine-phosphate synthase enzyme